MPGEEARLIDIKKILKEREEENKENLKKFNKKIKKFPKYLTKLRKLIDELNSFIYNIDKKPSYMLGLEKATNKVLKTFPKFTSNEKYIYLPKEYTLVMKYHICLNCKRDLYEILMNNEDTKKRIICNDCGITYQKTYKQPNLVEIPNLEEETGIVFDEDTAETDIPIAPQIPVGQFRTETGRYTHQNNPFTRPVFLEGTMEETREND